MCRAGKYAAPVDDTGIKLLFVGIDTDLVSLCQYFIILVMYLHPDYPNLVTQKLLPGLTPQGCVQPLRFEEQIESGADVGAYDIRMLQRGCRCPLGLNHPDSQARVA
jgi:hypothetical protein